MMTDNQRLLAQKDELIKKLSWNSRMGCFTRAGLEYIVWPEKACQARYIIYLDVNGVHALNDLHKTYAVFDAKIQQVLSKIRSTDVVAGQWQSGDEFAVLMIETPERPGEMDPQALVDRLTVELAKQKLTAFFLTAPVRGIDLEENVRPLADQVLELKAQRGVTR